VDEYRFEYYIEICECKNISKAAEKLYVSQPALSKYIRVLEKRLGTELIKRDSGQIELTEAGRLYYEYSKDMIERYERMKSDLELICKKNEKTITLCVAVNMSNYYLNDATKAALDIDPDFNIKVVEDTSLNMEKAVKSGKADVAFLYTDDLDDPRVEVTVVKKDSIFLVCSKENEMLKGRKTIEENGIKKYVFSKEETEKLLFYSRDKSFKLTEIVNRRLLKENIHIKNSIEVPDIHTMYCLIRDTKRFGFFPQFLVEEEKWFDNVSICTIDGCCLEAYLVLERAGNRQMTKPAEKWFKKLKEYYANKEKNPE